MPDWLVVTIIILSIIGFAIILIVQSIIGYIGLSQYNAFFNSICGAIVSVLFIFIGIAILIFVDSETILGCAILIFGIVLFLDYCLSGRRRKKKMEFVNENCATQAHNTQPAQKETQSRLTLKK